MKKREPQFKFFKVSIISFQYMAGYQKHNVCDPITFTESNMYVIQSDQKHNVCDPITFSRFTETESNMYVNQSVIAKFELNRPRTLQRNYKFHFQPCDIAVTLKKVKVTKQELTAKVMKKLSQCQISKLSL